MAEQLILKGTLEGHVSLPPTPPPPPISLPLQPTTTLDAGCDAMCLALPTQCLAQSPIAVAAVHGAWAHIEHQDTETAE
ncbi:hypothetical protein FHL15_007074 [Xylaria flabelliformis]|uniref:Uncharacterized protein n=1 Tax=Xylaria flabelliformis TaxID=2512241 RepID=A0A553HVM0_9PEZI|nr:hypothetical protein FHL15_007074 [Xylaria flabelliformis]